VTTFSDFLQRAATAGAQRTAVEDDTGTMTYGELDGRASRLAHAIGTLGVERGDRVADVQLNSARAVETIFGLARSGAIRVPINARLVDHEIRYIIEDSEPRVVILGVGYEHLAAPLLAEVGSVRAVLCHQLPAALPTACDDYEAALAAADMSDPGMAVGWDDCCSIRYTGGTTGRPKGVLLTHRSEVLSSFNILLDEVDLTRDDVFLHLQPLSHGGGGFVPPAVLRGATNIVPSAFSADAVLRLIEERGVTVVKLVPTMLLRLLTHPYLARRDLHTLRRVIYGASSMPVEPLRAAVRRFGPIFVQGYAQTEVPMTITCLGPEDHDFDNNPKAARRLSSAGRPVSTVRVKIVDAEGRAVPTGDVGEIAVQSPHQMTCYWRNDAATKESVVDGWVHTGDIGRTDEDGYVYILDRKGDVIITGGYNVYPREVENVLHQHPAVLEAAAFGVEHPDWVESVHAAVVVRAGEAVDADELIRFCSGRLSTYKRPKHIHLLDALPKNAVGKIVRREVRETVTALGKVGSA
jgi:acyl-CoA synthetase (AMP-forming)/AMP-acid ligase II